MLKGLRGSFAALFVVALAAGCVPGRAGGASPTPSTAPVAPAGWAAHEIGESRVSVALPEGWLVLDEAGLDDADQRARLEADYAGAEALFGQLDAQGRRARLVMLGVDDRARDTGRFPAAVTVVAVEPALPSLLLGIGADFAIDAFERTFELESDVTKSDIETPVGDGIRLQFTHRLVGPEGGPGIEVEHDGAIVSAGDRTYLVSRNVDPGTAPADTPTLDEVLDTLQVAP